MFFGILSTSLDSINREILQLKLLEVLSESDDYTLQNKTSSGQKLQVVYQKNRTITPKDFRQLFPQQRLENSVFIIFDKYKKYFRCKLYLYNQRKGQPVANLVPFKTIQFVSDIKYRIRKAARPIARAIDIHVLLETEEESNPILFQLKKPIPNATLTRDDIIIKEDSVSTVRIGTTLLLSDEANLQIVRGNGYKFLLFPNSSFTFLSSSIININHGTLGAISMTKPMTLSTPALICMLKDAILTLSLNKQRSHVRIFAGQILAKPSLSTLPADTLVSRTQAVTRGHNLEQTTMSDTSMIQNFKPFTSILNAKVIRHFKSTSPNIVLREPVYDLEFLKEKTSDPMFYFMAEAFEDIGIPIDALLLEGDIWKNDELTMKPGSHETGCYLCNPDRIGPVQP